MLDVPTWFPLTLAGVVLDRRGASTLETVNLCLGVRSYVGNVLSLLHNILPPLARKPVVTIHASPSRFGHFKLSGQG